METFRPLEGEEYRPAYRDIAYVKSEIRRRDAFQLAKKADAKLLGDKDHRTTQRRGVLIGHRIRDL